MKKTSITLLLGSLSISSLAIAQEIIPIDSNEDYSEQVESNNGYRQDIDINDEYREISNSELEAESNNKDKELKQGNSKQNYVIDSSASIGNSVNDYMSSTDNLSQEAIEEISNLQEERSLIEAKIRTAESKQRYIEIEQSIKELGGGENLEAPIMLGSHGVNGHIRAVINYKSNTYEISKGSFITSDWVVEKITKDTVEFLNVDDDRKMYISINSPSIIK
jgi:hypothetical protein